MRASLRVLSPLRHATRATSTSTRIPWSRTKLLAAVSAGATLAYAFVPYKQPLALDSSSSTRKTRSAWVEEPEPTNELEGSGSPEDEGNSAAFDPVTGEINWDCPCLGGMAHGPCGTEFREAFSCFIYSEDEPKGINCVEKFKGMQECFRAHPEVYGEEIDDSEQEQPSLGGETAPSDVKDLVDEAERALKSTPSESNLPEISTLKANPQSLPPSTEEHKADSSPPSPSSPSSLL